MTKKPKTRTKRKYIESHWLVFAIQGIVAMLAGWYVLFTPVEDTAHLVTFIGCVLLGLAAIEIFNIIHRRRRQHDWGIPLAVAIFEAAVGVTMIIARTSPHELHIALLAGYALVRGVACILVGFLSFENMTDRFLWVICGMCGCIIGFVILADPGISDTTFTKIFGTFLMILGLTQMVFAAHSRDQLKQIADSKKNKK